MLVICIIGAIHSINISYIHKTCTSANRLSKKAALLTWKRAKSGSITKWIKCSSNTASTNIHVKVSIVNTRKHEKHSHNNTKYSTKETNWVTPRQRASKWTNKENLCELQKLNWMASKFLMPFSHLLFSFISWCLLVLLSCISLFAGCWWCLNTFKYGSEVMSSVWVWWW